MHVCDERLDTKGTKELSTTGRNTEREIEALRKTLRALRSEKGCPWDREQKLDDIISYLIEEAYELLQAEKMGDWVHVEEELGDVFFLVIFIHELLLEERPTSLADIISRVHNKIVNRHPHVFGESRAKDKVESIAEWERIKKNEKKNHQLSGILASIPRELYPLRRATAIQRKAAEVGFDWPDYEGILEKLNEEIGELKKVLGKGESKKVKEEIGDILFTIVNLARRMQVDPENALEYTSAKFVRRFSEMEKTVSSQGREIEDLSLDEMEKYWQESKRTD